MDQYANQVKRKVKNHLASMEKVSCLFCQEGDKNFTRTRKLPFAKLLETIIFMGGQSLGKEMLHAFHMSSDAPTKEAFIRRRAKLTEDALPFLFKEFVDMFPCPRPMDGYRLIACDGSDLHYPTNPEETQDHFQDAPDVKGYNLMHLNALYDLYAKRYVDAIVQHGQHADEIGAFVQMIDRFHGDDKTIFTADRGYESNNVLAHIQEKGMKYLLRIKSPSSSGILKALHLPDSEAFDRSFLFELTKKQTNFVKSQPERFRYVPKSSRFDFCDLHHVLYYPMTIRVVCVEVLSGQFEYLVTNLDAATFPPDRLKALYHLRWGIETSFRTLKYTIGLSAFHAKKAQFIRQEVFARLIFFNLCQAIAFHAAIFHKTKALEYQLNFSQAVFILRCFFTLSPDEPVPDVIQLIRSQMLPIRPGRLRPRKARSHSAIAFSYRIV